MQTSSFIKMAAVGALVIGAQAFGANGEKNLLGSSAATCKCKGPADCTCKKGQCKCKSCGNGDKVQIFETLKGSHETTRLPDTARREDARGGVFI
jgi:hypothetical protein